jgi:hypothetical protein
MKMLFGTRVRKCYNTMFTQLQSMWQRWGLNTEAASAWKIIFKHRWCFNSSPAGHGADKCQVLQMMFAVVPNTGNEL